MNALAWLMLLCGVLQTLVLIDALPDGFNVYKDTLRGRSDDDDEEEAEAKAELLSKIFRYYRTPLHILDDGTSPAVAAVAAAAPLVADASGDVLAQFRKRTVSKFKSAFLYYLTHDLAHLQNILLFDGWLAAQRTAQRELAAARQAVHGHQHGAREATRAVYIPRAMV